MGTTLELLKTYLHDMDINIESEENSDAGPELRYYFIAMGTSLMVNLRLENGGELVQFNIYPRAHQLDSLPIATWEVLQETVNSFNMHVRYGRWTYDSDGDVRVNFSYHLDDQAFTRRQLARMHFILGDLVAFQAQHLQIIQHTGMALPECTTGLSGSAVLAAHENPELVSSIITGTHANERVARLLQYGVYAMAYHPKLNESGRRVVIHNPSHSSEPANWMDNTTIASVTPGDKLPAAFRHEAWAGPEADGMTWESLADQMQINEPAPPAGRALSAGAWILEPEDGRVWLVSPSNAFGGYLHTIPKGKREPDASLKATALKEVWEETGLQIRLTRWLGDFPRSTSVCRVYLAERVGGNPANMDWESQAVHLVPSEHLQLLLKANADQLVFNVWSAL